MLLTSSKSLNCFELPKLRKSFSLTEVLHLNLGSASSGQGLPLSPVCECSSALILCRLWPPEWTSPSQCPVLSASMHMPVASSPVSLRLLCWSRAVQDEDWVAGVWDAVMVEAEDTGEAAAIVAAFLATSLGWWLLMLLATGVTSRATIQLHSTSVCTSSLCCATVSLHTETDTSTHITTGHIWIFLFSPLPNPFSQSLTPSPHQKLLPFTDPISLSSSVTPSP